MILKNSWLWRYDVIILQKLPDFRYNWIVNNSKTKVDRDLISLPNDGYGVVALISIHLKMLITCLDRNFGSKLTQNYHFAVKIGRLRKNGKFSKKTKKDNRDSEDSYRKGAIKCKEEVLDKPKFHITFLIWWS